MKDFIAFALLQVIFALEELYVKLTGKPALAAKYQEKIDEAKKLKTNFDSQYADFQRKLEEYRKSREVRKPAE